MKKRMMILAVISIAVLTLGVTGSAFAQEADPATPASGGKGMRRGGGTGTGVPMEMNIQMDGLLEDYLHNYMADALGIDPATLADSNFEAIALELGYELTEIREIVKQAHTDALAQALADGVISQEVFDWMSERGFIVLADGNATGMNTRMGQGKGVGICDGTCLEDGGQLFDGTPQNKGYRGGRP